MIPNFIDTTSEVIANIVKTVTEDAAIGIFIWSNSTAVEVPNDESIILQE